MQTNQNIINRWNDSEGRLLLEEIMKCLKSGEELSSVKGIEKHAGRWDLRGAPLSSLANERTIAVGNRSLVQKTGSLYLKKQGIHSVDFSFAQVDYSVWEKCRIANCLFDETKLKEIKFRAADIENCVFTKANMSGSFLNVNDGVNSGSFVNCIFKEVNFSNTSFGFPIIKDCIFEDCKFLATLFDGSRFINCKFIGVLDSPVFRGYSVYAAKPALNIFKKFDPRDFPNTMDGVDFSAAKIVGASFTHDINLNKCKLPEGKEYIIINDLEYTMSTARKIIEEQWSGEYKRLGLGMIDGVYFKKDKHGKGRSIINTSPIPSSNLEFERAFFELLRKYN